MPAPGGFTELLISSYARNVEFFVGKSSMVLKRTRIQSYADRKFEDKKPGCTASYVDKLASFPKVK